LREYEDAFRVDWKPVGALLTIEAGKLVDTSAHAVFEGMHVYSSIDPKKAQDTKLKNWLMNTLDKMPGTHVVIRCARRKGASQNARPANTRLSFARSVLSICEAPKRRESIRGSSLI